MELKLGIKSLVVIAKLTNDEYHQIMLNDKEVNILLNSIKEFNSTILLNENKLESIEF